MKKLFISQPMKGKTKEEILAVRKEATEMAEVMVGGPFEVIDSFFEDAPAGAEPLWYLGKSLQLLSTADLVIFTPGWDEARGCKIEHTCAVEYDLDYIAMSIE